MARKTDGTASPDDEVRFTAIMRREDRARLKFFCEKFGLDMERVGAEWIIERLAKEEEHPPARPAPKTKK